MTAPQNTFLTQDSVNDERHVLENTGSERCTCACAAYCTFSGRTQPPLRASATRKTMGAEKLPKKLPRYRYACKTHHPTIDGLVCCQRRKRCARHHASSGSKLHGEMHGAISPHLARSWKVGHSGKLPRLLELLYLPEVNLFCGLQAWYAVQLAIVFA